jgi:GrpE protein
MAQTEQGEKDELFLPDNLENCHAELSAAQQELEEMKDKYLRAAAQVDNVRKWTERDTLARAKENQRKFLRQLLEVMDNLERALAQPGEPAMLYQGVQLTRNQLGKVLAQAGVQRMWQLPSLVIYMRTSFSGRPVSWLSGQQLSNGSLVQLWISRITMKFWVFHQTQTQRRSNRLTVNWPASIILM